MTKFVIVVLFGLALAKLVRSNANLEFDPRNPAFDPQVYEDALDEELCASQLSHIRRLNSTLLRIRFLEAGMRFPRGLLMGNTLDMGNYPQCLEINEDIGESVIEGKYCLIRGPMSQNFAKLAEAMKWSEWNEYDEDELLNILREADEKKSRIKISLPDIDGNTRAVDGGPLADPYFRLAVCIPKVCTTREGIRGLLFNFPTLGIQFEEEFCRFPNDKPWVPVDYVAVSIFSLIGLLTVLSTGYDIWHTFIAKKDPKTANTIYRSFSVYTNGRRLTTFSKNPNTIECIDGIRSIAILWVVVGHTYLTLPPTVNLIEVLRWVESLGSTWITGAHYTVDTFFMLSGLLVVYTTVGKLTGIKLLKNLHLFYLNRLLRMFPLLATIILMQASIFNRIADGPLWNTVASQTNECRTRWWDTLLYTQNFLTDMNFCIMHSWYLAIDMHCHILSPLVLFWVLSGKRKPAWISLTTGLLVSLTVAAVYCFIWQFPGWMIAPPRPEGASNDEYFMYYYFYTIPRTPPFFVGMIFGYLMHTWKGRKVQIPNILAVLLWALSLTLMFLLIYVTYLMKDLWNWNKWVIDDLVNSFARSLWCLALGWIIFACQFGYGGPANWFLSLDVWKLSSRISYALYLFHYPLQFVISGTATAPIHFTDALALYEFLRQMTLTFGVGFVVTLIFDSPFSTLFKLLLGGGPKKPKKQSEENGRKESEENGVKELEENDTKELEENERKDLEENGRKELGENERKDLEEKIKKELD